MTETVTGFAPVAASHGKPVRLAMQRLWLTGRVLSAGARLAVQHVFQSDEQRPIEVVYTFPLPRDAALRAFRITGAGFECHSELKRTEDAVKDYERGIADGSLATLARQYGDGLMSLTVGNIRPKETVTVVLDVLAGVELRDDGFRFRFPFTLAPSYHRRMSVAEVDGEHELGLPADDFGDLILPRWRNDARPLHAVGFDLAVPEGEIASPSHPIRVAGDHVSLAIARDVPNRDLVLDVRARETKPIVLAGQDSKGKRSYAAIVPSTVFGTPAETPRRVVLLMDRSGSMSGEPIAQERSAVEACLSLFSEQDYFGIVAFDDKVETLGSGLMPGTRENRDRAHAFVTGIDARGGTELARGVEAAAGMLGSGGGEVAIFTDGQVFGTEDILTAARNTGIRLFCLGIGSASQDRFLALLARETSGISRFVTPRERVDLAAIDLVASISRPVGTVDGTVVFAGTPYVQFGETEADSLEIGGLMTVPVAAGDATTGETVRLLRGSRMITDWEARYDSESKRNKSRITTRLIELSAEYGLASREMSLVAVVRREADRPGELPKMMVVPVGIPEGMEPQATFSAPPRPMRMLSQAPPSFERVSMMACPSPAPPVSSSASKLPPHYPLVDLAAALEPDGGMPGASLELRILRSIAAMLAFRAAGHSAAHGALRAHVFRLERFLRSKQLEPRLRKLVDSDIARPGDWVELARGDRRAIEEALAML